MKNQRIAFWTAIIGFTVLCSGCQTQIAHKSNPASVSDKYFQQKVAELIQHINDKPTFDHHEDTAAVSELIDIGRPSLYYGVLDLTLSNDYDTRLHAYMVLWWVTQAEMGHPRGQSTWDLDEENKWQELWKVNGPADFWNASEDARRIAYEKWRTWLKETEEVKK
jgi:hypothetical protein